MKVYKDRSASISDLPGRLHRMIGELQGREGIRNKKSWTTAAIVSKCKFGALHAESSAFDDTDVST